MFDMYTPCLFEIDLGEACMYVVCSHLLLHIIINANAILQKGRKILIYNRLSVYELYLPMLYCISLLISLL